MAEYALYNEFGTRTALARVGGVVADDIRESIDQWRNPPNRLSTIRRKRSGRDNPLVDSGDYMDAVDFALTGAGGD